MIFIKSGISGRLYLNQHMGEILFQLRGGGRSLISKISGRPEARNETANPCLETESGFL